MAFSPDPKEAVILFHALVRKIMMPFVWGEGASLSFIAYRATLLDLLEPKERKDKQKENDKDKKKKKKDKLNTSFGSTNDAFEDVSMAGATMDSGPGTQPESDAAVNIEVGMNQSNSDSNESEDSEDEDEAMPDLASLSDSTDNPDLFDEYGQIDSSDIPITPQFIRIVPWASWGPQSTRWFPTDDVPTQWITTSCGARFVLTHGGEGEPTSVDLYDFSRNRVKKAMWSVKRREEDELMRLYSGFNTRGGDGDRDGAGLKERVGAWVSDDIDAKAEAEAEAKSEDGPDDLELGEVDAQAEHSPILAMPGSWDPPAITPPALYAMSEASNNSEDITPWEDDPDAEEGASLRAQGSLNEWVLDEHDEALRFCGGGDHDLQPSGEIRLVLGEMSLPLSTARFFREEVVSGLPYIVVNRQFEKEYSSMLIEEECLIGLNVSRRVPHELVLKLILLFLDPR
jgi:hypothetical protein